MTRLLAYGIFLLCAYAAWLRGGVYPPFQWPMVAIAVLLVLGFLLIPGDKGRSSRSCMMQDPVFYIGVIFLILLVFQVANSGYGSLRFSENLTETLRSPPRWMPWSVERYLSGQLLMWFFPVWVMLCIVRNGLSRNDMKLVMQLLVFSSTVLALIGILQNLLMAEKIFGIWKMSRSGFFAAFGYVNHAAAFFYLNAALAAGFMHDAYSKWKPRMQTATWGFCFLTCSVAALLTLSRFGALVSCITWIVVLILLGKKISRTRGTQKAINAYIVMALLIMGGITLFIGVGGGALAEEISEKGLTGNHSLAHDLSRRTEEMPTVLKTIEEYPLFGTGGWGYSWLSEKSVPKAEWDSWQVIGQVNVHCDPLQYLSELGLLGISCLGAVVAILSVGAVRARKKVLSFWLLGGLAAVFVHSLIDLPFRCPAVLLEWTFLFAVLPALSRRTQERVNR